MLIHIFGMHNYFSCFEGLPFAFTLFLIDTITQIQLTGIEFTRFLIQRTKKACTVTKAIPNEYTVRVRTIACHWTFQTKMTQVGIGNIHDGISKHFLH